MPSSLTCAKITLAVKNLIKGGEGVTSEQIRALCLQKPGAYLDFPFGMDVACVKVKKRIFAQLFCLKGEPKATFNCDRATGLFYRSVYPNAVARGYHCPPVQQPYFNTVSLDGAVPDEEIERMIDHSYAVVVGKLPRYVQKELCSNDSENDQSPGTR